MKVAIVFLAAAVSLPLMWRDTNSRASSERGRHAYEKSDFAKSEAAYKRAEELAPSTINAFNLGTAQIAAGHREEGSAMLAKALEDPNLTADAYFNRGNSALAAKALDHAIGDYIQALKANPKHEAAKRNLEIALARKQAQQRAASSQQQQQKNQQQQQQQKPQPNQGAQKPQPGQMDLEALLRSVQQQEQEELRRMKAKSGEARIGW